jgi:hypothetical protein
LLNKIAIVDKRSKDEDVAHKKPAKEEEAAYLKLNTKSNVLVLHSGQCRPLFCSIDETVIEKACRVGILRSETIMNRIEVLRNYIS